MKCLKTFCLTSLLVVFSTASAMAAVTSNAFISYEGDLTIDMPGTPQRIVETTQHPTGTAVTIRYNMTGNDGFECDVTTWTFPLDITRASQNPLIDAYRDLMSFANRARIISDKEGRHNGRGFREVIFKLPNDHVAYVRYFVVDNRLHRVYVVAPPTAPSDRVGSVLSSFRTIR